MGLADVPTLGLDRQQKGPIGSRAEERRAMAVALEQEMKAVSDAKPNGVRQHSLLFHLHVRQNRTEALISEMGLYSAPKCLD